ncbi:TIGR01457 family HAD-type hydrolase [Paenibacillus sp. VCA1]|uniref:TIGR01457 family HAD-type hydrolase n=1 Tax=Paenibacillus sp. VCA1 TaxID=3039148 RepID=UPI00287101D1|nr:TIGR01457 family HAD-type hydrolase [Paenibacillus sp. VCA1]MDR9854092.1 TIGR01457 family HAD-type hydrolase [Paenibacillus sp. VCA1]
MAQNEKTKALLIDLDGTLYHGKHRIPGADELIRTLKQQGVPYLFVTNNSSRTAEGVASHLIGMGIPAEPGDVCTSSLAAAEYIAGESPGASVAMLGEEGLREALLDAGLHIVDENPQYVVQGIDRSFTYESLAQAVQWIRAGAAYVLTNPDLLLPSDHGLVPGAGSLAASIRAASGAEPVVIGKPSGHLIKYATDRLGISPGEATMVGDNMRTDIAAGAAAGCRTILVLTGLTTEENLEAQIEGAGVKPDVICKNLHELTEMIRSKS